MGVQKTFARVKANPVGHAVGLWARTEMKHAVRGRLIREFLSAHDVRYLKLGAGRHAEPGWLATDINPKYRDIVYMDATKPWPLPSNVFTAIHCEHLIEHMTYDHGQALLRESRRTLLPGGVLRVSTPDMALIRALLDGRNLRYVEHSNSELRDGQNRRNPIFAVNRLMRDWGHTFIYDEATLTEAMMNCGFSKVV